MKRAVVAGGAGFLGSHLCERLLADGWEVVAVDNFCTGARGNVADLSGNFSLVEQDVSEPFTIDGPVDGVFNFASPASPIDYANLPIETLKVGTFGTYNLLNLAKEKGARFLMASTSEVYGDPEIHPQVETYWGNVNSIGPRSVYDEAKRASEAYVMAFHRTMGLDTRIVRIFNTYGPRMRTNDGRAVPAFLTQALAGEPMTVFGDGSQTRSLCYVDDLVDGLVRLFESNYALPVNIGNPQEMTMLELAKTVKELTGAKSEIVFEPLPEDDPRRRRPDISVAQRELQWQPKVSLAEGLGKTIAWWPVPVRT